MARRYYVPGTKPVSPLLKLAFWTGAVLLTREVYGRLREQEIFGHVALVTGGSRGLGFLIARELGRSGCKVVICARDRAELDQAVSQLEQEGSKALGVVCDVSDKDAVAALINQAVEQFGRVDLLVNNAGAIEVGPVTAMDRADFEHAMNVMYWGVLNPILAVLPQMRERHSGKIANITSIGGKVAIPHLLPYVGAKFAAVGLSEGLAIELKTDGIAVTTVVPGLLRTGSYLHAEFKGDQEKESLWFTLSDNIPGLAMSPETAAKQIVRAMKRGETEVVLSLPAQILSLANGVFPGIVSAISSIIDKTVLPPSAAKPTDMKSGEQVRQQMRAENAPAEPILEMGDKQADQYLQNAPPVSSQNGTN